MENELAIGTIGASFFITLILGLIFNTWVINNKYKPWIALALGLVFSIIYMVYNGLAFNAKNIIDVSLSGLTVGLGAIGFHETGIKKVLPGKKQDPG